MRDVESMVNKANECMMQKILQLDNVMYKVKSLDASIPFYRDVLGLKQVWRDDERHMVGFRMMRGEGEIVLTSNADDPAFDYSFLVDDVQRFVSEVKEKGFQIAEEPIDVRCGKYAVLVDPDGNKIPIIDLTAFGGVPKYDVEN